MKNRSISIALMCASALPVFTAPLCVHAQTYLTYFSYQPGSGGTRIPHNGTPAKFVVLKGPTQVGPPLSPGATVPVDTAVPSTWTVSSTNPSTKYSLAYVNITGGAGGGISVFPDANGNIPMSVMNVPLPASPNPVVNVNAYYFPIGGGQGGQPCSGNCPSGANIGEFSDTSGTLLWDPFVNVFVPPSNTANTALTNTGNIYGTVNTTSNAARIEAYQTTVVGGTFDKWVTGPGGTIGPNIDLNAALGSSPYALALYHSACPAGFYRNSTPTVSQCSEAVCANGQEWDSAAAKCVPVPPGCPKSCAYGCYVPLKNPQTGQSEGWVCKPRP